MIEGQDRAVAFYPFVANDHDPLAGFNDVVMHEACFAAHPLNHEATFQFAEVQRRNKPNARVCEVCGRVIDNPDEFLTIGLITSNRTDPLYPYNCVHFHRRCASEWRGRTEFAETLRAARGEGRCGGLAIEAILEVMSAGPRDSV